MLVRAVYLVFICNLPPSIYGIRTVSPYHKSGRLVSLAGIYLNLIIAVLSIGNNWHKIHHIRSFGRMLVILTRLIGPPLQLLPDVNTHR